jgi:type IV pilus assembly protein PilC
MLFSRQLPLTNLIEISRTARHSLGAGIPITKVFRQMGTRAAAPIRPVAERIAIQLAGGDSLEAALDEVRDRFPPLFVSLVGVGERTGNLPEVFGEMEKYYLLQQRLWRQFISQITWPLIQFYAAIFIIAGLIYLLAIIGSMTSSKPIDILGFGLTGERGAGLFLLYAFGAQVAAYVGYCFLSRSLKHKAAFDRLVLRIPGFGGCVQTLAMMRFCLALRLTNETGMPIMDSLKLSLRGTGNAAFASQADRVAYDLRMGEDLTTALRATRLFTPEFEEIIAVAEQSGRLPEVMAQQAVYYEELAGLKMRLLTQIVGFAVWTCIAFMIIYAIISIWMHAVQPIYEMKI